MSPKGTDRPVTALLILHMQSGVIDQYPDTGLAVVNLLAGAIASARSQGIPIVYVRMAFRKGRPEIQAAARSNAFFVAFERGSRTSEIHDALRPGSADLVVDGSRASAFKGTDLDILLRSLGVRRLVLAGIGTSGVVLSTLIEAADLDYQVTVLSDGCTDPDPEVHRVLCEKVFPMRALVTTARAWIGSIAEVS